MLHFVLIISPAGSRFIPLFSSRCSFKSVPRDPISGGMTSPSSSPPSLMIANVRARPKIDLATPVSIVRGVSRLVANVEAYTSQPFAWLDAPLTPDTRSTAFHRAMKRHSWEDREPEVAPPRHASSHSWEQDPDGPHSSGDDEDGHAQSPGKQLVDHLMKLYLGRDLSAKDLCTICFFAGAAGVREARVYGYNPDAQSGHFQRHLNKVCTWMADKDRLYDVQVPSYHQADLGRGTHTLTGIPPHEAFDEQVCAEPGLRLHLREAIQAGHLPPTYSNHKVVRDNVGGNPVVPVSVFVDGVPYSLTDSVVGFWLINELNGARSLLACMRKKITCACGCRGWCSFWAIWDWLRWSLLALAKGEYPTRRHDGNAWLPSDARRAALAGQRMQFKACLLYIKGDWAEYASSLGLPSWQDGVRPCYACNAAPGTFYQVSGISPVGLPWRCNQATDYEQSCRRCERLVVVGADLHKKLCRLLRYDKRQRGGQGRCLGSDVPELSLRTGDRLEPSSFLRDVGHFEMMARFPAPLLFWRPSLQSDARHRCPLFDDALGTTPVDHLTVDALHAVFLGVMNSFCKHLLLFLIQEGMWGQRGQADETEQRAMLIIRAELRAFYRRRHEQNPGERLTRISVFSKKTIGDPSVKKLNTKGAETWGFLLYLLDRLPHSLNNLGPQAAQLLQAGRALERVVRVWDESGPTLSPAQVQECVDQWVVHMCLTADVPEVIIPKRHLVTHLLHNACAQGNPKRYANWLDEGLNRVLKKACRSVSQNTFESFLLLRMREILALQNQGLKRNAAIAL